MPPLVIRSLWIAPLLLVPALLAAPAVMATPLPEEWPSSAFPPDSLPVLAPLPASDPRESTPAPSRPARPEAVPAQVAVGDLSPGAVALAGGLSSLERDWLHPLPVLALEQSSWGWRWSDTRRAWRMHTGVDLIVDEGTPVMAARSGQVLLAEPVGGYGLTVLLDHGDGWQTLYAHLSGLEVGAGQWLAQGALLGRVGASGSATTPHLHLELRRRGALGMEALDPAPLLRAPLPPQSSSSTSG